MLYFTFLCLLHIHSALTSCALRSFGKRDFVCVCNLTFCDELEMLTDVPADHAALYETNDVGARFRPSIVPFSDKVNTGIPVLEVDNSQIYQFIVGFGGAFTEASGINIKSLPPKLQDQVLMSYFSEKGLSYNMGRVPMASSDFSSRLHSYSDVPYDFELKHFQLAKADYFYKIPLIKRAAAIRNGDLLLFAAPWSAPAWMKTNNAVLGTGSLRGRPGGRYFKTWANYFVKFLQEYEKNNITFWGITPQNQPFDGCLAALNTASSMCFPPQKQRDFIKFDLGPSLEKAGFGVDRLKLMILEDLRILLPKWVEVILNDPEAAKYVSGISFHWYLESFSPYTLLDETHEKFPNMIFLSTEASTGSAPWEPAVDLGDWDRAERYAVDIIQNLLHWSSGWMDWNLALNIQGGPSVANHSIDSPILINAEAQEFYKQPMYYALAHFSKCLPADSYRIGLRVPDEVTKFEKFYISAFETPGDKKVVIVINRNEADISLALHDPEKGYLHITVNGNEIQSYVW